MSCTKCGWRVGGNGAWKTTVAGKSPARLCLAPFIFLTMRNWNSKVLIPIPIVGAEREERKHVFWILEPEPSQPRLHIQPVQEGLFYKLSGPWRYSQSYNLCPTGFKIRNRRCNALPSQSTNSGVPRLSPAKHTPANFVQRNIYYLYTNPESICLVQWPSGFKLLFDPEEHQTQVWIMNTNNLLAGDGLIRFDIPQGP